MLHDQLLQLQMTLDLAKEQIKELEAGKKAGAPKARVALQKIKLLAHELRKACIVSQKAIPVKSKVKTTPTEPVAGSPAVAEPVAESSAVVDEVVCMLPAETPKPAKTSEISNYLSLILKKPGVYFYTILKCNLSLRKIPIFFAA